ncbi:Na+/proline symporter [Staphylococcus aureus]|uniref:sodium:solute symporter n=1 Tax=Staphylococcus aureus TaxID=1280 RepID=UPI0008A317E6|nr:sodium:solute symporter [Staphylococcus aureus]OFP00961.1 Na+/proline symporter [Staphylococcus aureus]
MKEVGFGTLNWVAVIIYLLAMLFIGVYFTKRASQSTNSFFTASGRLPSWVVGFSIYATTLSAITFMSTPEKAFLTDWSYIAGNIAIVAIIPLLIYFYVPFFKKLKVTSAYEYLEARFGPSIRVIGSLLFVVYHLGRVAIVIYLPTLAITSVSDMNPYIVASLVGLLCILYTFLGGFEGVVWSDFIQGVILLGGALVIIILGVMNIKGGFGTVFADAIEHKKLISADNWKLNTAAAAIPIIFLGNIFNNLYQYTASVVPYFILTEMPPFVAGLLIAAIFAAAQSTISSSLNSISACISIDIKQRFFGKDSERHEVNFARFIIIIAGIFGFGMSLYLIASNSNDLWDLFLFVTGLFGVPLAGVFAVGIFTKRTNTFGVICGLILGIIFAYVYNGVGKGNSPFYVSTISFTVAFVFAYILSFIVPSKHKKDITGLTIFEKDKPSTYISKTATNK